MDIFLALRTDSSRITENINVSCNYNSVFIKRNLMLIHFVLLEPFVAAPTLLLLERYFSYRLKSMLAHVTDLRGPNVSSRHFQVHYLPRSPGMSCSWRLQSARPDGPLCTHYLLLIPLWRWGHHKWYSVAKYPEFQMSVANLRYWINCDQWEMKRRDVFPCY